MNKIFLSHPLADPFSSDLTSSSEALGILKLKLIGYGFRVVTSADVSFSESTQLEHDLIDALKQCSVVVAFVISDSPNVFFELGCALGLSKPIVAVRGSEVRLPQSLAHFTYVQFRWPISELAVQIVEEIYRLQPDQPVQLRSPKEVVDVIRGDNVDFSGITASEFEGAVAQLFQQSGATISESDPFVDFGFDFYVEQPDDGLWLVEVKKYQPGANVTIDQVQQMLGAVEAYQAKKGVIITNTGFTRSAAKFAELAEGRIDLWDFQQARRELL